MMTRPHICLVDDDAELRCLLEKRLNDYGFAVTAFPAGDAFFAALNEMPSLDLLLLDVMLPGEDGLSICRRLRVPGTRWSEIPILFLSALGESVDRVIGLEVGGDDYLAKPFETRELIARIKALLRRSGRRSCERCTSPCFAGWTLDTFSRQLVDDEGVVVPLSSGEFRLLTLFLEHPRQILSRERIMLLSAEKGGVLYDRSIDTQIKRLRSKLRDDGRNPSLILTLRGDGYLLACDVTNTP